jgi:hypothetical protein
MFRAFPLSWSAPTQKPGNQPDTRPKAASFSYVCFRLRAPHSAKSIEIVLTTFARVERSVHITDELTNTSLGVFGVSGRKVGHMDLVYIESDDDGDTLGVEMGGGFGFKAGATFYAGGGLLVGYDSEDDFVGTAVYPEVGAVSRVGKSFGASWPAVICTRN